MRFLKFVIILLLVLLGAAFLYAGVGGDIPSLEYKGLKAFGLPIGIVFLVAAVFIAKYWDTSTTTTDTTEEEYSPDGLLTKIKRTIETTKRFNLPPGPEV